MGQHLRLYASNNVTVQEVEKWCHARANELSEVPSASDKPAVDKVQQEMDRLQRTSQPDSGLDVATALALYGNHYRVIPDHLEHWSNWCGVVIWTFLVWKPCVCDAVLVERAVEAAQKAMREHGKLNEMYRGTDFTKDEVIDFLRSHQGMVVWGDNDGI